MDPNKMPNSETAAYAPDALLDLGDGEYVLMQSARAADAVRFLRSMLRDHQDEAKAFWKHKRMSREMVLEHHRAVSSFILRSRFILQRLPELFATGCTLGELEGQREAAESDRRQRQAVGAS